MAMQEAKRRRLRLTERWIFIVVMCVLVAGGCYPRLATVSGALDRVLFDGASSLLMDDAAKHVVVINADQGSLGLLRSHPSSRVMHELLDALNGAGSVTLDMPLPAYEQWSALSDALASHGRVVVPLPAGLLGGDERSLPPDLAQHAAGSGHHRMLNGHLGVVSGFVPVVPGVINNRHVVLESIRVAGKAIPRRANHTWHPDWFNRVVDEALLVLPSIDAIPQYALADVLEGRAPADAFAGRMVFVGPSNWGGTAFRTSSIAAQPVSLAQLDALMAEAVMRDGKVYLLSLQSTLVLHLLMALTLILICTIGTGWRMHGVAIGWLLITLAMPMLMLSMRWWMGLGTLPVVYVLTYAYFAWENLRHVQRMWRSEMKQMHTMSGLMGMSLPRRHSRALGHRPDREMRAFLDEVRSWQHMAVNLIDQLPHPVLLMCDQRILLWNDSGSRLLSSHGDGRDAGRAACELQRTIGRARGANGGRKEVSFGGRDLLLLEVPFSMFGDGQAKSGNGSACTLVCLVDIVDVKEGVAQSQLALRHMAHDLRSPLSTMLALIEDERAAAAQEKDPAFLDDLRKQADYSLRIASDYLALSRAEQIQRRKLAPVALLDVALEAVDQCSFIAEQHGIALHAVECDGAQTLIDGSVDMLVRSVVNLVENAIKYSPEHSAVRVLVQCDEPGHGGRECAVIVEDDGIGIDAAHLQRLFEPFYQIAPSGVEGGVGLGLSFVQRVVEQHNGRVSVQSEPGRGSRFELRFPCLSPTELD